jgi:putative ATP-binding cassette transporter
MQLIRLLLKASVPLFTVSVLTSVLSGVSITFLIREIHMAVGSDTSSASSFLNSFIPLVLLYFVASIVASYSISELTRRIVHNLRLDLSAKIIRANYSKLESRKARILPVLTDDISTIAIVIERLPSVANGIATVLGILVYMIYLSPFLALATIAAFAIIAVLNKIILHFIAKYSQKARESSNEVYRSFEGLVYGLASLKMNRPFRETFTREEIEPGSARQTRYYLYHNVLNAVANRVNDIVLFLFLGGIILAIFHYDVVSMDFFNQYLTLVLFMLAPLATITGFLSTLKKIEASVIQITNLGLSLSETHLPDDLQLKSAKIFDTPAAKRAPSEQVPNREIISEPVKGIEIRYLVFHHENLDSGGIGFTLGPISHNFPAGRITFITGGNGSGKTTLIKLICGLYLPAEGSINYRGVPVTTELNAIYRDQFAIIFTDNYTFNHLLHIPEEVIEKRGAELIELVGLTGKVTIKNGRFSDVNLSEGQKKRLVLVSALLEDKPIYVFDEWVAYQDQVSRNLFFHTILPWLKERGKTVINIAHDTGYEHIADEILHLNYGIKVTEEESPKP